MLGSFNFLENIREENDADLENEVEGEDVLCDEEILPKELAASSDPDRTDEGSMTIPTDLQEDKELVASPSTSDTCETSFGSIDHTTQSLSDTSSCVYWHEEVVPRGTFRQSRVVVDELDVRLSSNPTHRQQQPSSSSWTMYSPAQTCSGGDQRNWSSNIAWFVGRVIPSRKQDKQEETTASKKWFSVIRKPTPSSATTPNLHQLLLDTMQSWKTTSMSMTNMTRSTPNRPFQQTATTNNDSNIKASCHHRERRYHRKTPSGSFASAIGRE